MKTLIIPNEPKYWKHPITGLVCPQCDSPVRYLWYYSYNCDSCNLLLKFEAGEEVAIYVKEFHDFIPYSVWTNPSRRLGKHCLN